MRTCTTALILIVDDDTAFVDDLLRLWRPGSPVRTARSSREALDVLATESVDLILLDLSMPHHLAPIDDEEGIALLRAIRRDLGCMTPLIVVTGNATGGIRNRVLDLGANAVLRKPVDLTVLDREVGRICGRGG